MFQLNFLNVFFNFDLKQSAKSSIQPTKNLFGREPFFFHFNVSNIYLSVMVG